MNMKPFGVLTATTLYVVIRYMVFGDVAPEHFPAFLVNKSISLAAVVSLAIAATAFAHGLPDAYRVWIRTFGHLTFLHILLSLALFSEGNYPKFFAAGRLSRIGEWMLLFGVVTAYCFWRVGSIQPQSTWRVPVIGLSCVLLAAHLLVMGFSGWLTVEKWHGGLPPISLLSCLLAVWSLIHFVRRKRM